MKAPNLVKHLTLILTTTLIVVGFPALAVDPVECGLETDGWVLVRAETLREETPVVTMGQFLLNDGVRVDVRPGTGTPGGQDPRAAAAEGAPSGSVIADVHPRGHGAVLREN